MKQRDMKKLLILLLIFGSISAKSQDILPQQSEAQKSRFSIGAYFSPDAADIYLQSTDNKQSTEDFIENRNSRETMKFGYTTGLSVVYLLNEKFSLETGLEYSNKGYQTKKVGLNFGVGQGLSNPPRGFVFDEGSETATDVRFVYHYQYAGIPVKLNYTVGNGKWRFISSIGLTAEYLMRASSTTVLYYDEERPNRENDIDDQDYNTFNLSPSISAGVDYQLNPRMSLRAMPTFRAGLLKIMDDTPVTGYLYSAGVQLGWYMTL